MAGGALQGTSRATARSLSLGQGADQQGAGLYRPQYARRHLTPPKSSASAPVAREPLSSVRAAWRRRCGHPAPQARPRHEDFAHRASSRRHWRRIADELGFRSQAHFSRAFRTRSASRRAHSSRRCGGKINAALAAQRTRRLCLAQKLARISIASVSRKAAVKAEPGMRGLGLNRLSVIFCARSYLAGGEVGRRRSGRRLRFVSALRCKRRSRFSCLAFRLAPGPDRLRPRPSASRTHPSDAPPTPQPSRTVGCDRGHVPGRSLEGDG